MYINMFALTFTLHSYHTYMNGFSRALTQDRPQNSRRQAYRVFGLELSSRNAANSRKIISAVRLFDFNLLLSGGSLLFLKVSKLFEKFHFDGLRKPQARSWVVGRAVDK